jgi:hypothetical protein
MVGEDALTRVVRTTTVRRQQHGERAAAVTLALLGLSGVAVVSGIAPSVAFAAEDPMPTVTPAPAPAPTPAATPSGSGDAPTPAAPVPAAPVAEAPAPTPPAIDERTEPAPVATPAASTVTPPPAAAAAKPAPKKDAGAANEVAAAAKIAEDSLNLTTPKRKSSGERLLGRFGRDLEVSGGWTLHGQSNSVSGGMAGQQTYRDQNVNSLDYRNIGPVQNNMDMTISGKIFNLWKVNARLSNSRFGNRFDQVFGFNYKNKGTTVDLGTISPRLAGNELVSMSRSIQGIMFSRDLSPQLSTTNILSLTRATTRRGSFQGQGTSGPYYLSATQLVEGSERMQLNGRDLQAGKDYRLDYYLGQVTFLGGLIINPTDTVTFTYEAQAFNTTPGLLTGTRWNYSGKDGTAYGVTYITQKASGARARNGNVVEPFAVVGVGGAGGGIADPQFRYYLSSLIDPSQPVVVRYGSRLLSEGVDYYINRELRFLLLKSPLPADTALTGTASLQVEYRPVRQNAVAGDRAVLGLDTTMRVARNGTVAMTFGNSESQNKAQVGTGMNLSTSWQFGERDAKNALGVTLGYRDIGQGFTSIDSTSSAFLQAQKGVNASLTFTPNRYYNITTTLTQSKVANQFGGGYSNYGGGTGLLGSSGATGTDTTGTGANGTTGLANQAASVIWATNQAMNTALNVQFPHLPTLQFSHGQTLQTTGGVSGSRSTFTSDSATLGWSRGILALTGGLTRTVSRGQSVFSNGFVSSVTTTQGGLTGTPLDQVRNGQFAQSVSDSVSDSSRFSVTLTPAQWFNITGDLGFSRNRFGSSGAGVTAGMGGSAAKARNTGLSLNLQPFPGMSLNLGMTDTSNGQSTAGFYGSTGTTGGAGSNGSQLGNVVSGQRTRATNLGWQYAPWRRLAFGANFSRSLSLIPGYDNSENSATDFLIDATPFDKLHVSLNSSRQRVTYVGGQGNSDNKSYTMNATVGPFGRMSFTSTLMKMDFGSATYSTFSNGGSAPFAGTGVGTMGGASTIGYLQNGVSTSWTFRTDYNVGQNRSLYARWQGLSQGAPTQTVTSGSSGSSGGAGAYHSTNNFQQGVGSIGLEVRLSDVVGFTLGWNTLHLTDREDTRYSYKAHSLTADLSARF